MSSIQKLQTKKVDAKVDAVSSSSTSYFWAYLIGISIFILLLCGMWVSDAIEKRKYGKDKEVYLLEKDFQEYVYHDL